MTFERRVRLCDIDGMYTIPIAPEKWQKLYGFLRAHPRVYAGNEENCRRFIVAVYWILRTGAQWRALPERFGKWNSVYRRLPAGKIAGYWRNSMTTLSVTRT